MFAAALLDLGLPRKELEQDLAGLGVDHKLTVRRVHRNGLAARYFDVKVPGAAKRRKAAKAKKASGHASHGHGGSRNYAEIRDLLAASKLQAPVRERALAIFEALGRAEARVHGVALEEVHFHEVGAVDAIVDVASAAIGIERLGVERVTSSPVALGHGMIDSSHGKLPLPAPATLELLKGAVSYTHLTLPTKA